MKTKLQKLMKRGIATAVAVACSAWICGCRDTSDDQAKWVESDWIAMKAKDGKIYHIEIKMADDGNVKWRFGKLAE